MTDQVVKMAEMVERFNRDLIGIPIPDRPTILNFQRGEFRLSHLREELEEIVEGVMHEDMEKTTDGLLDLVYVALGTLIEMGITPGAAFEEVHRANMDKQQGELSKRPGSAGFDAVKPEGWQPPDLEPYMTLTREEILNPLIRLTMTNGSLVSFSGTLEPPKPKVLVLGYGRHGKDTVCEMLEQDYGFQFTSSSMFCAEPRCPATFQQLAGSAFVQHRRGVLPGSTRTYGRHGASNGLVQCHS